MSVIETFDDEIHYTKYTKMQVLYPKTEKKMSKIL